MAAVPVLVRGDVAAAWMALLAGNNLLEVPDAAAAMHNVIKRCAMPMLYQFAENIIDRYVRGELTWRFLWMDVAALILMDPNMTQAYQTFLDFLQVASTRQAGLAAADPPRNPETERDYTGVITTPALQDKSMEVACMFLPGLREAVRVGLQLTQVQQNQLAMQQAMVDAAVPRTAMLESNKPNLLDALMHAGEVPTEVELVPYWAGFVKLQMAEWTAAGNGGTYSTSSLQN